MEEEPKGISVSRIAAMKQSTTEATSTDWGAVLTRMSQQRDKALFAQLFQHFAPRVKAYILRQGLTESVAEELMQETLLNVWRKAHLYCAEKAAASTWIFTLARNASIDWMRKQKYPDYAFEDIEQHTLASEQSHEGEQWVERGRMAAMIESLPENQMQVIYLSFYEGRSHTDIAQRLGIPLGSVKSRLRLACRKIRAAWEQAS